uniref:G-protein coupled receptors family 1 profile domain-containing protein n=1 Tax=Heliothis virescens TaxID=7102 RepID=A0A2A4JU37_HELVI
MGYLAERCPVVQRACGLPLRAAAALVALAGSLGAAAYLFLYSAGGAALLARAASGAAPALRLAHGALGVLLLALHALLLAAAASESDALCDVYVWGMLVCAPAQLLAGLALAAAALLSGWLLFAGATFLVVLLSVLINIYFVIVVVNYRLTMP